MPSAMACVCFSLIPLVIRKKSVNPESIGSSSRIFVASPFLSSQTEAAASTILRVSVDAIFGGFFSPGLLMVACPAAERHLYPIMEAVLSGFNAVEPVFADVIRYSRGQDSPGVGVSRRVVAKRGAYFRG